MGRQKCLRLPPEIVAALRERLNAKLLSSSYDDASGVQSYVRMLNNHLRTIREHTKPDRRFARVRIEFETRDVKIGRVQRAFNLKPSSCGASRGLRDLICLCLTDNKLDWPSFLRTNFASFEQSLPEPDEAQELSRSGSEQATKAELANRFRRIGQQLRRIIGDQAKLKPGPWSDSEVENLAKSTLNIARLAVDMAVPRQKEAARKIIYQALSELRRVREGRIRIEGREPGYFQRQREVLDQCNEPEHIQAYIRLIRFDPAELVEKTWFETVYRRYVEDVAEGRLTIDYIFLLQTSRGNAAELEFISRYKAFANTISTLAEADERLAPDLIAPSIVLLNNRKVAFTHDRGPGSILIEADEWVLKSNFVQLKKKYEQLSVLSNLVFDRRTLNSEGRTS